MLVLFSIYILVNVMKMDRDRCWGLFFIMMNGHVVSKPIKKYKSILKMKIIDIINLKDIQAPVLKI